MERQGLGCAKMTVGFIQSTIAERLADRKQQTIHIWLAKVTLPPWLFLLHPLYLWSYLSLLPLLNVLVDELEFYTILDTNSYIFEHWVMM